MVILVGTLSGGFERATVVSPPLVSRNGTTPKGGNLTTTTTANQSSSFSTPRFCAGRTFWNECHILDASIHPVHLLSPWVITFGTIVFLSMPTVLLRSRYKEKGLRLFAGNLAQFISLFAFSTLVSDNPSICYTFALHACVHYLCVVNVSPALWGGGLWWGIRYVVLTLILFGQLVLGPPVSVVRWNTRSTALDDTAEVSQGLLQCAYLSHLIGCIAPDMVLFLAKSFLVCGCYFHMRVE